MVVVVVAAVAAARTPSTMIRDGSGMRLSRSTETPRLHRSIGGLVSKSCDDQKYSQLSPASSRSPNDPSTHAQLQNMSRIEASGAG